MLANQCPDNPKLDTAVPQTAKEMEVHDRSSRHHIVVVIIDTNIPVAIGIIIQTLLWLVG